MNVTELLKESMKTKPASNRGARKKTSTPKDVIRMNFNENGYGMSDKVKAAIVETALGSYMYQDFYAVDIKEKLAAIYGLTKDHVLIGSGSSAVIDMLGEVFINPGDEVVYCMPSYEAFPDMVSDNGGVRIEVPVDKNYKFDLDGMLAAVTNRTKMAIVVNPNNPTGTYVNSSKVEEFVRRLPENVVAVVDEAYFEYVDDDTHYSLIRLIQEGYDKPLIILRTFSKIYGLAGLRIGYAIGDPLLIDELMKACQAWNVGRNAQLAAIAALEDQDYIKKIKALNIINREYVSNELKKMGCDVVKPAANFIYFDAHRDSQAVRNKLAEMKIMIGAPDKFNRVSIGTEEQNKAFIKAMKNVMTEVPKRV
ncbi:MAG: histidinol-phosphate aminotransferase family protein [Clostridiales bacterium]|nr:histidinol-phosphate aminotransferase family protein [Clostridiales bacterium]